VVGKECVPNYGRNPALPAVDGEGVGKQPPGERVGMDGWMDEARVWDWDWGQWRECVGLGLEREPRRKPETEKKHDGGV
jgi:hypothetical protein